MSYRSHVGLSYTGSLENILNLYYGFKKTSSYLYDYKLKMPYASAPSSMTVDKRNIPTDDHDQLFFAGEGFIVNHKNNPINIQKLSPDEQKQKDNLYSFVLDLKGVKWGVTEIDRLAKKLATDHELVMNFVKQGEEYTDTQIKTKKSNTLYGKIFESLFTISDHYYLDEDHFDPPRKVKGGIEIKLNSLKKISCYKQPKEIEEIVERAFTPVFILHPELIKLTNKFYSNLTLEEKIEKMIEYTDLDSLNKLLSHNPLLKTNAKIKKVIQNKLISEYEGFYKNHFSQKTFLTVLECLQKNDFIFENLPNKFKTNGNFTDEAFLMEKLILSLKVNKNSTLYKKQKL